MLIVWGSNFVYHRLLNVDVLLSLFRRLSRMPYYHVKAPASAGITRWGYSQRCQVDERGR